MGQISTVWHTVAFRLLPSGLNFYTIATIMSSLGKRVRRLRVAAKLSQSALAEQASCSKATVIKIETDAPGYRPSVSTLESIASALKRRLRIQFVPVEEIDREAVG